MISYEFGVLQARPKHLRDAATSSETCAEYVGAVSVQFLEKHVGALALDAGPYGPRTVGSSIHCTGAAPSGCPSSFFSFKSQSRKRLWACVPVVPMRLKSLSPFCVSVLRRFG